MNRQTFFAGYLTVILGIAAFFIYSELKGPQFKAGDCVSWTVGGEFKNRTYTVVILKVGKKEYLTAPISDNAVILAHTDGERFRDLEKYYSKTECTYTQVVE